LPAAAAALHAVGAGKGTCIGVWCATLPSLKHGVVQSGLNRIQLASRRTSNNTLINRLLNVVLTRFSQVAR
jgi:hypothetical protein